MKEVKHMLKNEDGQYKKTQKIHASSNQRIQQLQVKDQGQHNKVETQEKYRA